MPISVRLPPGPSNTDLPDTTDDAQQTEAQDQKRREFRDALLATLLGICFIHDGDVEAARGMWDQHAQPAYRGMLDDSGKYSFDPQTQLYTRSSTGRTLPPAEVKRISINFAAGIGRDIIETDAAHLPSPANFAQLDKWATTTARDLKDAAIVQGALAAGDFNRITPLIRDSILGNAGKAPGLRFSFSRLADFAAEVEEGTPRLSTPQAIIARSGLYATALNGLYEQVRFDSHNGAVDDTGRRLFLYERNLMTPGAEHCAPSAHADGCQEMSDAGWVPMGTLSKPGQRSCGPNCLCALAYRLTPEDEDE